MKRTEFSVVVSTLFVALFLVSAGNTSAAPVRFNQVVQVVNITPGKSNTGNFAKLKLAGDFIAVSEGDGDDDKKKKDASPVPQDGRVITTTVAEIAEDDACDCTEAIVIDKAGFPKWPLFGLGAVPLAFIKIPNDSPTPTPTTATPTPPTSTPTPQEPIPEPMTLLLFGTGLAGVGLAARRKFGKQEEDEDSV